MYCPLNSTTIFRTKAQVHEIKYTFNSKFKPLKFALTFKILVSSYDSQNLISVLGSLYLFIYKYTSPSHQTYVPSEVFHANIYTSPTGTTPPPFEQPQLRTTNLCPQADWVSFWVSFNGWNSFLISDPALAGQLNRFRTGAGRIGI